MSDSQAITFRAARPEDHKTLLEINQEGQPGVATLDLAELRRLEALADYLKVLEVGGRVSGYLIGFLRGTEYDGEEFGWFRRTYPDPFLYVDQIAVSSRSRKRGLGQALYDDIEAFAMRKLISRLTCEVNLEPPNPASLEFHRRIGFSEVGRMNTRDGRTVALLSRHVGDATKAAGD